MIREFVFTVKRGFLPCITAAVFFCFWIMAAGEKAEKEKPVLAEIRHISGTVLLVRNNKELQAENGMDCYENDMIRVKKDSHAELKLKCGSGSRMLVRPETTCTLFSGKASAEDMKKFLFTLQKGALRAIVESPGNDASFEIQTPVLVASAWGTDFVVRVLTIKETRVSVLEGMVKVSLLPEAMGKYLGPQMMLLEDGRQIAVHADIGFCSIQEIPEDRIQKMKEPFGAAGIGIAPVAAEEDTGRTGSADDSEPNTSETLTREDGIPEKKNQDAEGPEGEGAVRVTAVAPAGDNEVAPVDTGLISSDDTAVISNNTVPSPGAEIGGTVIPVENTMEAVADSADAIELPDDDPEVIEHGDGLLTDSVFDQVIGQVTGTGGGTSEQTDENETSDEQFRLDEVNEERRVPEPPARPGN